MPASKQLTGMRGVFLVASELSKTNATTFGFWLLNEKARKLRSPDHIYVLVNIRKKKQTESIEYYIVPSSVVAEKMKAGVPSPTGKWSVPSFGLTDAKPFKDNWALFGSPTGEIVPSTDRA